MHNYKIVLISNDPRKIKQSLTVSESQLLKLEKLQNSGGFKRFEIDIIDNTKGKTNYKDSAIFFARL